jgi:hypothetical protein
MLPHVSLFLGVYCLYIQGKNVWLEAAYFSVLVVLMFVDPCIILQFLQ